MRYHLVLLLLLCCWPKPSPAHSWSGSGNTPTTPPAGYFSFSPLARSIYQNILSLRFAEARAALPTLRRQEPSNLIVAYLENTLEVLQILVDDDQAAYERWSGGMNARLSRIARGDARSPYFLFTQAEIRLQWAALRLRYGDYWSGLNNIKQGYSLLRENQRRYPAFRANLKSQAILHALVGNIPGEYKWAVQWLSGIEGTVGQGLTELNRLLDEASGQDFVWEEETRIACAFLQLHLANNQQAAWQTLSSSKRLDPQSNPLAAFVLANLAIRTARNDEAIRLLEHCPQGAPFHPFPYRDYLLGIARLNRLDPDAGQALERFIREFKGQNGIKEACQKLAWHHLLAGRPEQYRHYMALVQSRGTERSEPDKAALREARSGEWPDVQLLRARLLFDGGYYRRAYALLSHAGANYTQSGKSGLEYHYRMGRIAHALGQLPEAVRYYTFTIEAGARQPWFFACNAALQLGLLYEQRQEKKLARAAFRRCLDIRPEEYGAGLHTRAKAGLERVRG